VCGLPDESDLDGRGETGGEEVGRQFRVHGQQFVRPTGGQLNTVARGPAAIGCCVGLTIHRLGCMNNVSDE